jgi:DNA-binding transcriptional LysR family regulator
VAFHARYEISDVPTILAMVQEGLGVSIVPAMNIPDVMPGLAALRLDPPAYRHLSLATLSGGAPPAVEAFIDQARVWSEAQDIIMRRGRHQRAEETERPLDSDVTSPFILFLEIRENGCEASRCCAAHGIA